jgi:hypothetical protein
MVALLALAEGLLGLPVLSFLARLLDGSTDSGDEATRSLF